MLVGPNAVVNCKRVLLNTNIYGNVNEFDVQIIVSLVPHERIMKSRRVSRQRYLIFFLGYSSHENLYSFKKNLGITGPPRFRSPWK